jgi:hypothetical protein
MLEYASMAWMTAEGTVAAGVLASLIALVGFRLDSVIEFVLGTGVVAHSVGAAARLRRAGRGAGAR